MTEYMTKNTDAALVGSVVGTVLCVGLFVGAFLLLVWLAFWVVRRSQSAQDWRREDYYQWPTEDQPRSDEFF